MATDHMPETSYTFPAPLWIWSAQESATWVFVTLPEDISADIREVPRPHQRGFGSIRVEVAIGATRWTTSVFPDSKTGCYVLPIKKAVRKAEHLEVGDTAEVALTTLD